MSWFSAITDKITDKIGDFFGDEVREEYGDEVVAEVEYSTLADPNEEVLTGADRELVSLYHDVLNGVYTPSRFHSLDDIMCAKNTLEVHVKLGSLVKSIIAPAGTTVEKARKTFGSKLMVDHTRLVLPPDRPLYGGETIECSLSSRRVSAAEPKKKPHAAPKKPFKRKGPRLDRPDHVVFLMLENRSFDQMLSKVRLPPKHPGWDVRADLPEAKQVVWPDPGHNVAEVQGNQLGMGADGKPHNVERNPTNCGCTMRMSTSGFDKDYEEVKQTELAKKAPESGATTTCAYVEEDVKALAWLAKNFSCSDEYFCGLAGPTVPNRMLLMTCDTPDDSHHNPEGPGELIQYMKGLSAVPSLFEKLETCPVALEEDVEPFSVYYQDTPISIFLSRLAGEQHGRFQEFDEFKGAVESNNLPLFTFIEPRYYDHPEKQEYADDSHPPHRVDLSDELICQIYDVLQANPEVAERTLFIITYDEHGGTYDHVVPPKWENGETHELKQVGFRVPFIAVSPNVPFRSVLKASEIRTPRGNYRSTNPAGSFLTHASLSATFHKWYGTDLLTARDAAAATFCHLWQPGQGRGKGLPKMPFTVMAPRDAAGKPLELHHYPDTGSFATIESLACDLYLETLRPSLSGSGAPSSVVSNWTSSAQSILQKLKDSGEYSTPMKHVFDVALAALRTLGKTEPGPKSTMVLARCLQAPVAIVKRTHRPSQASFGTELRPANGHVSVGHADDDADMIEVYNAMVGRGGVQVEDRVFAGVRYHQCFLGSECVSWIARHCRVSRFEALKIGRKLRKNGRFAHISEEEKDLEDHSYFYVFLPRQGVPEPVAHTSEANSADLAAATDAHGRLSSKTGGLSNVLGSLGDYKKKLQAKKDKYKFW